MNVLVIGGGGREHALAWKIASSPRVAKVFVAPGNAGTAGEPELTNVAITAIPELVAFAQQQRVGLTVVGPEAPLAAGIVDAFRAADLKIFGPTSAAAQLESSKDYAKAFMARHGIPTAQSRTFSDAGEARAYVAVHGAPIVVKADGLAAGKGVVVATTVDEAHAAIDAMLVGNALGAAGARVVVEEFLEGEEASFIVMADGRDVLPLASSQDHKRLLDGDRGPNTGGMGAYSPAPVVTPALHARIMREVIVPTVAGMAADGIPYTGFLYAGVMIDDRGNPKVLEFNCRMGDPETQPIIVRLKSDLVDLLGHAVNGTLDGERRGMGPPRGARRRAGRARLSGRPAQGRRDRRPRPRQRAVASRLQGLPRRHEARRRQDHCHRRTRAVRHGARRLGQAGAAGRLRGDRRHPFRRHAISDRHRAPRARPAQSLTLGRHCRDAGSSCRLQGVNGSIAVPPHRSRPLPDPMDVTAPRDYFLDLQARIVAALEAIDGAPFRRDAWERPEGGGGVSRLIEEGNVLERGGVNFSHVKGGGAAAVGNGIAPRNRRPRVGGDGRVAGAASAQSLCADGAHERAAVRRARRRAPVTMSGGSAAAWT